MSIWLGNCYCVPCDANLLELKVEAALQSQGCE